MSIPEKLWVWVNYPDNDKKIWTLSDDGKELGDGTWGGDYCFRGDYVEKLEAKLDKVGALLPDDLYDSKDWRHADSLGRIEWLIQMLANKNEEIDVWVGMLNQKEKTE
jgi:hypothetical protein